VPSAEMKFVLLTEDVAMAQLPIHQGS
jgi:hypothetical protein